jgi:hypothetical protein
MEWMSRDGKRMRAAKEYFRANPQVLILLIVCVVLGLGTFIIVVISIATSGGQNTGYPEGSVLSFARAAGHGAGLIARSVV